MRDSSHSKIQRPLGSGARRARGAIALAAPAAAACLLAFGGGAASASAAHHHRRGTHRPHASTSQRHHARSHADHGRQHSKSASSSMYIKESAKLHRVGRAHGFDLNEQGVVGGTIKGKIYLQLHVTSTKSVSATVKVYPHGGSLTGAGKGSYGVRGANASFSGSLSITGGSGSFKGAHGGGLRFSGSIKRGNDSMTVYLSGRLDR